MCHKGNWDSFVAAACTFNSLGNYKLGSLQRHKLGKRSYKSANGDFSGILPKFSFVGKIEKEMDKFSSSTVQLLIKRTFMKMAAQGFSLLETFETNCCGR